MDFIVPPPLGVHTSGDGKKFLKSEPPWRGGDNRFVPIGPPANRPPNQHTRLGLLASGEVQEVVPGSRFDVAFSRLSRRDLVRPRDCQPTFLDHD